MVVSAIRGVFRRAKGGAPWWLNTLEASALFGRATLFVNYWEQELLRGVHYLAPLLFVFSWAVFAWRSEVPWSTEKISKLPECERRKYTWIAITSMVAFNLPPFWFGLKAAVREGLTNGLSQ